MDDGSDPLPGTELSTLEQAIDAVFFRPFATALRVAEQIPEAAGRVREQLVFARFVGRLAVQQGNVEIRRRLQGDADGAAVDVVDEVDEHIAGEAVEEESAEDDPPVVAEDQILADELALPDYDQLPAAHIIEKLDALTTAERELIGSYEAAHRGRRTVLGKLERLRGS